MKNREEVKGYVTKCYRLVLKRKPDRGGLNSYTAAIMTGRVSRSQLPIILRNSAEWKKRFQGKSTSIIHRKKDIQSAKDLVSIIVLEYNTLEVLKPCIASVLNKTVHPYELLVVDNGSVDGSFEWILRHKGIHLVIENSENFGWTKGNNIGMKNAKGQHFLLLNSDTVVRNKGWLRNMVAWATKPNVGTVGAKLLYPNGKIQHIGGGIKGGNPYHPYDKSPSNVPQAQKSRSVPYCTGACLLIKKSTVEKVGHLNEQYRFGYGDVDYGLRVVMRGLQNIYCHNAVLTHHWAYTQRKLKLMIKREMLNLYMRQWRGKLPQIAKRVKLTW